MALFNYATKEITLKIVYYGPGLSGKTTNIEFLHSTFDPKRRGKLLSLSTEADRTLFFDFLPIEIGKIKDFSIRFQLYTVPGQVRYNSTRKLVLKGADAIVFIADSQQEMREANIESLENMKENLLENNLDPEDIPVVFQYNKRDLHSAIPLDELNKDLNARGCRYFEGIAIDGKGIQETFQAITKQILKHIANKHRIDIVKSAAERPVPPVSTEPAIEEETPSLEALHAEAAQTMDIEEPIEAEAVVSSTEEVTGAEEIPSLEDLQKEIAQDFETQQAAEAESILTSSEESVDVGELPSVEDLQEEGTDEAFILEEQPMVDAGSESEIPDLVNTEFEETNTEQVMDLQDQDEIMKDSAIEAFESEEPSEDFSGLAEKEFTELTQEETEPESKDDSIESIYKAFMSDELEEGKPEITAVEEEILTPPVTPMEKPTPEIEEIPSTPVEPLKETPLEENKSFTPPVESIKETPPGDKKSEIDALRAFSDSVSPSIMKAPATPKEDTFTPPAAPSREGVSEATKNVILDEINSLSKTINKMNNSISSFKSELNVLSDKVLDIEKRFSSLSNQTGEIKEAVENSSGTGAQLSSETLQTIMELKKTIDRAKKKKFWLLFS